MTPTVPDRLIDVPLRSLKADIRQGESDLQKLKEEAGGVLDLARKNVQMEAKQMGDDLDLSQSLVLRVFRGQDDIGFLRLWRLSNEFWAELLIAIAKKRGIALVRTVIELPDRRAL